VTEIGLSLETPVWIAVDANHDTHRFRVDADRARAVVAAQRALGAQVLTDAEHGEIWSFEADR
jgi:hypothetical protein